MINQDKRKDKEKEKSKVYLEEVGNHFRGSSILQFKILAYFKTVMMNEGETILREINEKTDKSVEPDDRKE